MFRRFFSRIRGKKGTAVLEAALCLPVLFYLIFFIIEIFRVGVYQVVVDNMALKLAFEYSALKSSANFEKIIEDTKPVLFKSMDNIHCRICVFRNLDALLNSRSISEDPQWMKSSLVSIRYPDGTISETTAGCAFVVTVSCDFPFSSSFIKKMFAGGTNYGDSFLLWSRTVNVCH